MYDPDGCLINTRITGDNQMVSKRIGTFYSVVEAQKRLILAIWHKYTHVPQQT